MGLAVVRTVSQAIAGPLSRNPLTRRWMNQALMAGRRVSGGVMITPTGGLGNILRRVATALGFGAVLEWLVPDSLFNLFDYSAPAGITVNPSVGGGASGQAMHPAPVVKEWTANGTPFVRLQNGIMGARKKTGVWRYWRPKKPIVMYRGGSSDLRTLLRADAAVDRQLKKLAKAIKRREPTPRRRRSLPEPAKVIVEQGPGNVISP